MAVAQLKEAGRKTSTAEERAVHYLLSASEAGSLLDSSASGGSAGNGQMWNHPLTLTCGGTTYRLRLAKGTRDGVWDPGYFTAFIPAAEVSLKTINRRIRQDGIGGALVGVHKADPLEHFSPVVGVTAPVTAVLDFKGRDVTLSLIDPTKMTKARTAGAERVLDADFSAPLAYYPQKSEYWNGIMGAIHVDSYMKTTGLYMVQPYDPDRIPVIFVHGLISTPRMSRNVINEIETDPTLRSRYQYLAFSYPTGNPPAYSAMRLREEMAKYHQLNPKPRKFVLIGHSMGGLLSRMQATTVTRESWDVIGKDKAKRFFKDVKKGDLVDRCAIFEANPQVAREVFICTPHRGSTMAVGRIGDLGMHLISLPLDLTSSLTGSFGNSVAAITGDPKRMPNSVTGLAPSNPMLKVLESSPMHAPYHTIVGDCCRGVMPKSSDGVVDYSSSRLNKARSERIVPGPHGSCELPQTIVELRRILHIHLKETGR